MNASFPTLRMPNFRAIYERDRDFYNILVLVLLIGLIIFYILATFTLFMADHSEPERYARVVVGGQGVAAARVGIAGGGGGGGAGGGGGGGRGGASVIGGAPGSLLSMISTRSAHGQSALGRVFGKGGLGSGVDRLVGAVRQGNGGKGSGGGGGDGVGQGFGRSRGFGAGELGDGSGFGGKGFGGVGTGYGGNGGDNIDLGVHANRTVYAKLERGQASVEGSLDSSLIENVVRQNLAGLRYCYEKELNLNPSLAGKVVVQFTIGLSGEITVAGLESSSLKAAQAEDCMLRRIKRWRFPKPQGGDVVVSYPFIFSPSI